MDCNKYISLEDQIIDSEYLACSCCLKHMTESLCTDYTSVLLDAEITYMWTGWSNLVNMWLEHTFSHTGFLTLIHPLTFVG